jgi:hypothetical protein
MNGPSVWTELAGGGQVGTYADGMLGTAARNILSGKITPDGLLAAMSRCWRCGNTGAEDWWREKCWHHAAALLFDHGLRISNSPPGAPTLFQK